MTPNEQRDAYLRVAERNLEMASHLFTTSHLEGTVFHSYHAMECAARAAVRARGDTTTDFTHGHKTAFKTMNALYQFRDDPQLKGFASHILTVSAHAENMRSEALYPDEEVGVRPEDRWSEDECREYRDNSLAFCQTVRFRIT